MLKSNLIVACAIMAAMMGFFVGKPSCARAEDFDEMNYSYGKIFDIKPQEITITEYDYEKDQEINVAYAVAPAMELQNISSFNDLAVGEEVEIYYSEKDGKKTATIISRPQVEDGPVENDNDESVTEPDNLPANKEEIQTNLLENKTDSTKLGTTAKGELK